MIDSYQHSNFCFAEIKGKLGPVVPTSYVDWLLLVKERPDIINKRIYDVTYPKDYVETKELLVAKSSYLTYCMRTTQAKLENRISELQNQLEEKNKFIERIYSSSFWAFIYGMGAVILYLYDFFFGKFSPQSKNYER